MNSGVITEIKDVTIIKYEDVVTYQIKNNEELKGKNLVNYIKSVEKKK